LRLIRVRAVRAVLELRVRFRPESSAESGCPAAGPRAIQTLLGV
jgi:hypothetical protein